MSAAAVRVALVPGTLALLPEYASIEDPVSDLRRAAATAVGSLRGRVAVLAGGTGGERVGRALIEAAGLAAPVPLVQRPEAVVVVANGSAKRTDRAPGHFDPRAEAFDDRLRDQILAGRAPDDETTGLAEALWADVAALSALAAACRPDPGSTEIGYDAAPFGVAYLVATWTGRWLG